jgi:hypothetical protein
VHYLFQDTPIPALSIMNKLANLNMRHWSEVRPNFGMGSRPNVPTIPGAAGHNKVTPQGAPPILPPPAINSPIHFSFNVPFASDLTGPNTEDILHATTDAVLRWTHPEDAADDVPVWELPVHAQNLAALRQTCQDITGSPLGIEAHVFTTMPKHSKGQVTTVSIAGPPEIVYRARETILNQTPLSLVSANFLWSKIP